MTPLYGACKTGKIELTKHLLNVPTVDVNAELEGGWTSLHAASLAGHKEIIRMLVANGADKQKLAYDPEHGGMVTPIQLGVNYNGSDMEEIYDISTSNVDTQSTFEEEDCDQQPQSFGCLKDFDRLLVKPLATKCYLHDHVLPDDLINELLEEGIINQPMVNRVRRIAQHLQDGVMTPAGFVDQLEMIRSEEASNNDYGSGKDYGRMKSTSEIRKGSSSGLVFVKLNVSSHYY